ncbi:hypothetical protein ABID14_000344 [Peptoniphilus olsenii]|uniref:DUF2577 domain-containing protein n=1 Tax=Peptoniphilus olsenii TaxID=411570 RepID=A0ABV2J7I5_9FIRM
MQQKNNGAQEIVDLFDPSPEFESLPYCETGEVISPLPDLEIKVRDINYKKKNIKLDEYWVKGHEREIEIPSAPFIGADSKGDSHIAGGYPKAKIIFKDELKAGDLVACLQSKDKQTIYVIFKIARW